MAPPFFMKENDAEHLMGAILTTSVGLPQRACPMCSCCGGSAGPRFCAGDGSADHTVGKSFQLKSPSYIVDVKQGES